MTRSHRNLRVPPKAKCPACQAEKLPHEVCPECGQYKGRTYRVKVVQ